MRFIILTNPSIDNNVVKELISSGLVPEMIVSGNPFDVSKTNTVKFFLKRAKLFAKYYFTKSDIKKRYKPYFLAKKNDIKFYNSKKVNTKTFEELIKKLNIDYIFTFGFKILEENIINSPKKGCINFHPAYLPYNRGATPSKWVILNNQNKTGITFHYINKGIDTGDIIEQYEVPLSGYENTKILNKYLFDLGTTTLIKLIYKIKNGIKINTLKNNIDAGSYEPPFKRKNSIISENMTSKKICKTIQASIDGYNGAIYYYGEKEFNILNYIEISKLTLKIDKYPFLDSENNIYIKSKDNFTVVLITSKKIE